MLKRLLPIFAGCSILCLSVLTVSAAPSGRAANLKSEGVYAITRGTENILIDAADLVKLATEIDELELAYKENTRDALATVGVYFDSSGNPVHTTTGNNVIPTFDALFEGISISQEPQGSDVAVTWDNVSLNKVCYINGEYIKGNGNDVNNAYSKGYNDGVNYATGHANITYVYHVHKNGSGNAVTAEKVYTTIAPGGCYVAAGHTHNATGTCATKFTTHTHTDACDTGLGSHIVVTGCPRRDEPGAVVDYCTLCGKEGSAGTGVWGLCPLNITYNCNDLPLNSGKTWACGSPVNTYVLGCGKTTSTIESAIIDFR